MDYGMIGKREKAKRAKQLISERHRFKIMKIEIGFQGDGTNHNITFENGVFKCDCKIFLKDKNCEHTIALQELLEDVTDVFNDDPLGKLPGDSTTDAPLPPKKKVKV